MADDGSGSSSGSGGSGSGKAEAIVGGLLKFLGGVAAGWFLHALAGGEVKSRSSGGDGSGAKKKKKKASTTAAAAGGAAPKKCAAAAVGGGTRAGGGGLRPRAAPAQQLPRPGEELKMVLCVNTGLGMGKGKIGAQCAHAAVGVTGRYRGRHEALFRSWEAHGQVRGAVLGWACVLRIALLALLLLWSAWRRDGSRPPVGPPKRTHVS